MSSFLNWLKITAAILGPLVTIVGLIQSKGWLAVIGALLFCITAAAVIYARHQRILVDGARIEIEGVSIDALNAANLRRRASRNFMIQDAEHRAVIDGANVEMVWSYAGYCRTASETAFEFTVVSETGNPFRILDCHGYDLRDDPQRQHRIMPLLRGPDGISKRMAIPFARPVSAQQPFEIEFHCRIPEAFKPGPSYYVSTLSFDQPTIRHCVVQLTFRGPPPEWVRVYECPPGGRPRLLRTLTPVRQAKGAVEYVDAAENRDARSARVYLFQPKT